MLHYLYIYLCSGTGIKTSDDQATIPRGTRRFLSRIGTFLINVKTTRHLHNN